MDWCIAEHYLKLKAQELKQCIFSLIEHRRLLGSQFWGNAGNFVWKILGDARPTLIHKKCLHRGWELPQILRNPNHQVLVVCQAHVLLCHQQAIFSILWKTDCCLLFTVGLHLFHCSCGHSWSSPPECHSARLDTTLPCLLSMRMTKVAFSYSSAVKAP